MRIIAILAIMLLVSPALASSTVPPVSNVSQANLDFAPSLDNSYDPDSAVNSTIGMRFGTYVQNVSLNASMSIAGMSLMVDNSTYPLAGLSVILQRGYQQGHLTSLPNSGYPDFACNLYFFQHISDETAWRCDFDSDTCAEYENSSAARYDMIATFSFGNVTGSVAMDPDSNVVEVPENVLERMSDSSGAEQLNVSVDGNVTFLYTINDRVAHGVDCGSNYTNISRSVPLSASRNFTVSGTKKLFFMRSPVLREQWLLSNAFDTVVLSQSPLSHALVSFDGAPARDFQLRNFSVVTDQNGLEEIVSNSTFPAGTSESRNITKPLPLEFGNSSFLYAYEFNYSYAGAVSGVHGLSILVNDSFGGSANFSDSLKSRYLSYNGTTSELGTPSAAQPTRGSGSFTPDVLAHIQVGIGLVAFVMFLAFVNFWLT